MDHFEANFNENDYVIRKWLTAALAKRDLERVKSWWTYSLWTKRLSRVDHVFPAANQRYFNPVSDRWRKQICAKLGIGVKSSLPTGHFKMLEKPTKRVPVKMDGNCFYRSLSVWVTGDQTAHDLLRQELVKFMSTSTQMSDFFGGDENRQCYMATANVDKPGEWATEIELMAASFFLNTTIMVYCSNGDKWDWQMFHKSGLYPDTPDQYEAFIYLVNTNRNHFDPVIDVKYNPDYKKATDELYLTLFALKDVFKLCFKKNFKKVLPTKPTDLEIIHEDRVLCLRSLVPKKRSADVEKILEKKLTNVSDRQSKFADFEKICRRSVKNVLENNGSEEKTSEPVDILVEDCSAAYTNKKSFWKRTKRFLKRFACCGSKRLVD